jgi:N-acetylglutamate synthase-like GNAT family acetyltransferase
VCGRPQGTTPPGAARSNERIESAGAAGFGRTPTERLATPLEVMPAIVQYQVRTARITDVERIVALLDAAHDRSGAGRVPLGASDLLRQLVGLPHAVVLVAESGRRVAGAAVLALRPSVVLGGFVGTIDVLAIDPASPPSAVTEALLEELLRSGRNKGCVAVEAATPRDPAERERWVDLGFSEAGPRLVRTIAPVGARPD